MLKSRTHGYTIEITGSPSDGIHIWKILRPDKSVLMISKQHDSIKSCSEELCLFAATFNIPITYFVPTDKTKVKGDN